MMKALKLINYNDDDHAYATPHLPWRVEWEKYSQKEFTIWCRQNGVGIDDWVASYRSSSFRHENDAILCYLKFA